jgi:signal transduction histidine kinase
LLSLLNDFLDLSKIEAGKLEIAPTAGDLVGVCTRVVNGYQSAAIDKGVAPTFTVTGDPPPVLIFDTVRVRLCLTNLVSNALKFTPIGEIAVTLGCATDPVSRRMGVRLAITDTGIGMSAATLSKLFGATISSGLCRFLAIYPSFDPGPQAHNRDGSLRRVQTTQVMRGFCGH